MVVVPHKKHLPWEKLEIKIYKKEAFKFFIFKMLVGIPRINLGIKKFLLSLPIQRRFVEYIISFMVSNLKCLVHLQDIYPKCKMHNRHGNHLHKGMFIRAFFFNILFLLKIIVELNLCSYTTWIVLLKDMLSMSWGAFETCEPWKKEGINNWQANWDCKLTNGLFEHQLPLFHLWGAWWMVPSHVPTKQVENY